MMIIGLTGGIGSGKSTVANLFKNLGILVIDADTIAHKLCEPNEAAYAMLIEHFGVSILKNDGHIDRKKLRDIVFTHDLEREWLEATLHPLIRKDMHKQAKTVHAAYCIFVIPLLTETDNFDDIDRILVVDTPEELQLARVSSRDHMPIGDIKKIMEAQNSRGERLTYADDVILNDSNVQSLERRVKELDSYYKSMAMR